ncbi:MAG: glycosyltransferase family 1 protein [Saprospirales bacterium]|nr:MAG: glycosyltransferase family 1 protein [Saprospirales bacterium]
MKLGIIADALDNQNAGVHVYTREMIKSLIRFNPGWEILLIRQKRDDSLQGVRQIVLKNIPMPIGYSSFRLFLLIPAILRKEKVDVVIEPAHFGPFNLPKQVKRITVIHDLTPLLFPNFHRFHSQFLQRLFLKRILKNADLIISNSNHTQKDIERVFPFASNKTVMIYPGLGLNSSEIIQQPIPREIGTDYFLTVGTIEPRKNHILILDAFELFKKQNPGNVQLVICGAMGWKSQPFFDRLKDHPFREFICLSGFVEDGVLLSLYKNALAMVYPSTYEGFGLPVAESIAAGTIPITTPFSSIREVAGNNPFYLNELKAKDLSELMERVYKLSSEEIKTIISELQDHISRFSWDVYGEKLWNEIVFISDSKT